MAKVSGPFEKMASVLRFHLNEKPSKADEGREHDTDQVCVDEPRGRPSEGERHDEREARIEGESNKGDHSP